jgi:hypothetical protein
MHVLPQAVLFRLIEESDCELLDLREDDSTGSMDSVSNCLLVRKRQPKFPRGALTAALRLLGAGGTRPTP